MNQPAIDPRFSISDELWEKIKPLLRAQPPKPKGGRPGMDDRRAMTPINPDDPQKVDDAPA